MYSYAGIVYTPEIFLCTSLNIIKFVHSYFYVRIRMYINVCLCATQTYADYPYADFACVGMHMMCIYGNEDLPTSMSVLMSTFIHIHGTKVCASLQLPTKCHCDVTVYYFVFLTLILVPSLVKLR